jgi:uracil-DNA glycosylase
LIEALDDVALVLLVGTYAQTYYLGDRRQRNLTETVRAFATYGPRDLPLPHPAWRSKLWMKRNPWFEAEVLPHLRARVQAIRRALG